MPDDISKGNTDFDDLNRELAGISGNRAERFFNDGGTIDARSGDKRYKRKSALQTQLDLLMMDPAFAEAYLEAVKTTDNVQALLNERRTQLAENIEHLETVIETLEDSTAKLADGRVVFRDEKGHLVDAEKNALTPAEIATISDPDTVANYAPYGQAKDALHAARQRQSKYDGYQDRIDNARKRLESPDDQDAVDGIQQDMEDLKRELESDISIGNRFSFSSTPTADEIVTDLNLDMEELIP